MVDTPLITQSLIHFFNNINHINMRIIIIIVFISGIYFSCKETSNNKNYGSIPEIVYDSDNLADSIDISEIIDSTFFRIIPLETNNTSLIGKMSKLFFKHNRFYILDQMQKSIIVFDERGKFIFKFNASGKGPGEYVEIASATITDHNIIIADNILEKLFYYDLSGKFVKEFGKQKVWHLDIFSLNDGYLYSNNSWFSDAIIGKYMFFKTDSTGRNVKKYFPFRSDDRGWRIKNNHSIYDNTAYVIYGSVDTIFRVSVNTEIEPAYRINIVKNSIPHTMKYKGNSLDIAEENDYSLGMYSIITMPDDILIGIDDYVIRHNISTGQTKTGYSFAVKYFPEFTPETIQGEYILREFPANSFLEWFGYDYKDGKYDNFPEYKARIKELLSTVNEMDNPLIFMHKIRK